MQHTVEATKAAQRDYFQLFALPAAFDLDLAELAERYRLLQQKFHPDRFSGGTASEQRVAAQVSAEINAGYTTLRDPVRRAGYLLERLGKEKERLERQPVASEFLFKQIELREALQALPENDHEARGQLQQDIKGLFDAEINAFREHMASEDVDAASTAWVHLLYLNKLRQEVGATQYQ